MKFLNFLWVIFALLDTDPDPENTGSESNINIGLEKSQILLKKS